MSNSDVVKIHEEIVWIVKDIESGQPLFGNRLLEIKDRLFNEYIVNRNTRVIYINPFALGQAIGVLDILKEQNTNMQEDWWSLIHPDIKRVSKKLYVDGSYANAACDAFIEVNDRVKKLFRKKRPDDKVPDGDAAMKTVFSLNAPLIEFGDRTTESGANQVRILKKGSWKCLQVQCLLSVIQRHMPTLK